MKFDNNPEKAEQQQFKVLPAGKYTFKVNKATDEVSRVGNEMIKLQLSIRGEDRLHYIFDYLVPKMAFKIKHFCQSIGRDELFESGELTAELCLGSQGVVEIRVEPATHAYAEKNVVLDYIPDDIPF